MRQWLLSVVGAAMLASAAMALCPRGRVRAVTRFVCALGCMLSLVSPLQKLDGEGLLPSLAAYRAEGEALVAKELAKGESEQREYIQQQCTAYILTEAQEMGIAVDGVRVLARWEEDGGVWLPAYVTVDAPFNAQLSETIERELAIAGEAQRWRE